MDALSVALVAGRFVPAHTDDPIVLPGEGHLTNWFTLVVSDVVEPCRLLDGTMAEAVKWGIIPDATFALVMVAIPPLVSFMVLTVTVLPLIELVDEVLRAEADADRGACGLDGACCVLLLLLIVNLSLVINAYSCRCKVQRGMVDFFRFFVCVGFQFWRDGVGCGI